MDIIVVRHPFTGFDLLCRRKNFSARTTMVSLLSSSQAISNFFAHFKTRLTVFLETVVSCHRTEGIRTQDYLMKLSGFIESATKISVEMGLNLFG